MFGGKQCGPRSAGVGLHCLTKRFLKHFIRLHKQITFVVIGVLWVTFCFRTPLLAPFANKSLVSKELFSKKINCGSEELTEQVCIK